jgi:methionine-rich copper-binding protein CopC
MSSKVGQWSGAVFLLTALLAGEAAAHAVMVKATPAEDSVLANSPAVVSVWFNEPLEAAFSSLTVSDARTRVVAKGALEAIADNGLSLPLDAALPAGTYTVRYRVLSVDGHIVEDQFRFVIDAAR